MSFFRFFIFSIFLFACHANKTVSVQQLTANANSFPEKWEGKWEGNLQIFTAKGLKQTLPMQLHIEPTDSTDTWTWTIFYGEDLVSGKRAYLLKAKDKSNGIFEIDEQNSINLEAYFLGDKLVQRFEVAGSLLMTTSELRDDYLVWEIIYGSIENPTLTGNTIQNQDTIPEVKSYPLKGIQRAFLKELNHRNNFFYQ